ncbi:MAG TPA: penicillin acylase family protein [Nocardioidaceae bacterium]|nr:penicillin acylase family protein [Nocardioidaceae bacterium]
MPLGRTFRSWPRFARWSTYAVVVLVLALVASATSAVVIVRKPFPQTEGRIELTGLDSEVRVLRDAYGIPQIYAETSDDLFYAQGFVQAQDRFWQMDAWRHITAGRLSELLGEDALEVDKFTRTMGWRRVAEQELALLDRDTVAHLEAFSRGVTAYLRSQSLSELSLEYSLLSTVGLDYEPEDWSPVDSLAWLKAMAWDLHGNTLDELTRATLSARFTAEQIAELYPPYDDTRAEPVLRATAFQGRPAAAAAIDRASRALEAFPQLIGRGDGIGSNAWVVSGARSSTGSPILANDPHLAPSLPGIWYQMGLHCTTVTSACPYDVTGFTFAGVPGVVIGHNQDIAWGFTNLEADVSDLYLERVEGHDYRYGGKLRPLVEHDEEIEILGEDEPFRYTVRATHHGPLMSDIDADWSTAGANATVPEGAPERENGYAVAIQWTGLIPGKTMDALFALDRASDFDSFREAVRDFASPSQNIVYADRAGHIGYQAPGLVPIRKPGVNPDYPSPGWLKRYDWTGRFVPFDAMPYELDPHQGLIVTANQPVVGEDFPHYLGDSWDYGYRSQRILDLLGGQGALSPADMSTIQLDDWNGLAAQLVPVLMGVDLGPHFESLGQRLLADWDYTQPVDSPAAAYFNAVWRSLLSLTFHDDLPEDLWPDRGSRWFAVMTRLVAQPTSPWWDDRLTHDVVETRDDILRAALLEGRDEQIRLQDRDATKWRWGNEHVLELRNQTLGSGDNPIANLLLNRGPYAVAGGDSVVNAVGWDATEGYGVVWAPSMRMVVSLADFDESTWINLTGASGHAYSEHYTDQTELWVDGRTLPFVYSRDVLEDRAEDVLVLVPDLPAGS